MLCNCIIYGIFGAHILVKSCHYKLMCYGYPWDVDFGTMKNWTLRSNVPPTSVQVVPWQCSWPTRLGILHGAVIVFLNMTVQCWLNLTTLVWWGCSESNTSPPMEGSSNTQHMHTGNIEPKVRRIAILRWSLKPRASTQAETQQLAGPHVHHQCLSISSSPSHGNLALAAPPALYSKTRQPAVH